jgi:hypothetical protein
MNVSSRSSSRSLRALFVVAVALTVIISACRQGPTATIPAPTAVPPTAAVQPTSPAPTEAVTTAPVVDTNLLYFDDFADLNSGWPVVQPENGLGSYQNPEVYRLEARAAGVTVHAFRSGAFSDYALEAVMFAPAAGGGRWRHGITFRQVTPDNFYAFVIIPRAQTWQVLKRFLGEWSIMAEGTSNVISLDPATPATLRLDALGPAMTFSINGTGVVALSDGTFAAGDIGLILETLDDPSVQVAADQISVRRYDAALVPSAPTAAPLAPTETPTPSPTVTGTPPTATQALTPLTGSAVPSVQPTANLLTAVPATLAAVSATAASIASQVPIFLTQPCGLPTLPACP